ncbi:MAG TPA: hypothetical protein VFV93_10685 [Thermomicrobiales bacterium]|nr:hypothetical protein [Thermomicrobiales bacterium]
MDQVIQVVGAMMILAGFVLAQFKVLRVESMTYLVLNVIGSAILAWLAWDDRQWGFLLLEGVWAIVSAWSIIQLLRGGDVPSAH